MADVNRFRVLHGFIKGLIRNMIDLAHSRIPKEDLITNGVNKPRQPELSNLSHCFHYAWEKHGIGMPESSGDAIPARRVYVKGKELGLSVLGSDTAHYLLVEYALKEYCHVKMDDLICPHCNKTVGSEAVDKAWNAQWNKKSAELLNEFKLMKKNLEVKQ